MTIWVLPLPLARQTTPPAALITLTSVTSRIFVATVAPSSAATLCCWPSLNPRPVVRLAAKPSGVEDGEGHPRDGCRRGDRHDPRRGDVRTEVPPHRGKVAASSYTHDRAGDHVRRAHGQPNERRGLDHDRARQLRRHAGGRVELHDVPSQCADDAPASGIGAEPN